ncbi:hypothetical protein EGR_07635 [Echinococcus granulosus]|uniref:Transmembrane protein n=1 Tax=Echinococcus granulosus TaxID=6210 RepID=W6UVT1_ECHGR|nr:hypothetical protein EGR_07635 [Echinococcus granulosus]EUB57544.1 hypothetical protein EGR_07635 [Echinococcus granulosus]
MYHQPETSFLTTGQGLHSPYKIQDYATSFFIKIARVKSPHYLFAVFAFSVAVFGVWVNAKRPSKLPEGGQEAQHGSRQSYVKMQSEYRFGQVFSDSINLDVESKERVESDIFCSIDVNDSKNGKHGVNFARRKKKKMTTKTILPNRIKKPDSEALKMFTPLHVRPNSTEHENKKVKRKREDKERVDHEKALGDRTLSRTPTAKKHSRRESRRR